MDSEERAKKLFARLPFVEYLHVRARAFSAPLSEIARRAPPGRIAEIGCGHGLLIALLAVDRPDRQVIGVDPDPKKIDLAKRALDALSNVALEVGDAAVLEGRFIGSLDALVIADVLYLLPMAQRLELLRLGRRLLKSGGTLLLKEVEADGSWRHAKVLLQERAMVHWLGRTQGSGGLGFLSREQMIDQAQQAGLVLEEAIGLGKGYSSPHVLLSLKAP